MKPAVYTYPAPEKFNVYFRGYVKEYQGATVITHSCTEVRQNKFVALEDAKKLIKKLKKQNEKNSNLGSIPVSFRPV